MVKVVLDTNIIVSALHFGGNPAKILNLANKGSIELLVSPFISDETSNVLRKKLHWNERGITTAITALHEIATIIYPTEKISIIKEKDSDNRILECAVSGRADFIVSGDTKHILPLGNYQGIRILKATEFLALVIS